MPSQLEIASVKEGTNRNCLVAMVRLSWPCTAVLVATMFNAVAAMTATMPPVAHHPMEVPPMAKEVIEISAEGLARSTSERSQRPRGHNSNCPHEHVVQGEFCQEFCMDSEGAAVLSKSEKDDVQTILVGSCADDGFASKMDVLDVSVYKQGNASSTVMRRHLKDINKKHGSGCNRCHMLRNETCADFCISSALDTWKESDINIKSGNCTARGYGMFVFEKSVTMFKQSGRETAIIPIE